MRSDGRKNDQIRHTKITRNYIKHAEGSVLIEDRRYKGNLYCINRRESTSIFKRYWRRVDNSGI